MGNLLVHTMDTPWTSSAPALLQVTLENQVHFIEGAGSNRLLVATGAVNQTAEVAFAPSRDLSAFQELRFWIRAGRMADGTSSWPFYLEFSYDDDGDAGPGEHRWFVPINKP